MILGLGKKGMSKSYDALGSKTKDYSLINHIASYTPIVMPDKNAKRLLSGKDIGDLFSFY